MTETEIRLARLLAEIAYREADVTLTSGRSSGFYIDAKKLTYHPEGMELVGRAVFGRIRALDVQAIGGMVLGAVAIVTSTVLTARLAGVDIPGFVLRKDARMHGLQKMIEGIAPEPGSRVAIVEDVVTSGGSVIESVERVREAGLEVATALVLVDREEGGAQAIAATGVPFQAICTVSQIRALRDTAPPADARERRA